MLTTQTVPSLIYFVYSDQFSLCIEKYAKRYTQKCSPGSDILMPEQPRGPNPTKGEKKNELNEAL